MEFYRDAFDRLLEGCQILSPEWTYLYLNDAAVRHSRKTRQELIGRTFPEVYPGVENTPLFGMLRQCLRNGQSAGMANEFTFDDGTTGWFDLSVEAVPEGILVMSVERTGQVNATEQVRRLNRIQMVLSNVNQAIVRIRDLGELFERACRIAVNDGGFAMAWIGLTDTGGERIVPVASDGKTAGYFATIDTSVHGRGNADSPMLEVVREGKRIVRNMLPGDFGFRSLASFPLTASGSVAGVITFFSGEPDFFDGSELKLLDELAMDLSFAMEVAETENLRHESEKALRENEEKFRKAFYLSPDAVNVNRFEDGRYVSVNQGFTRIMGYTEEELIGNTSLGMKIWADPADREKLLAGLRTNGSVENLETDFLTRQGERKRGLMSATLIDINGSPHIISITRDITRQKLSEEALFAEREKLAVTLRSIGDGVIATDVEGRVTLMNEVAEQLCGCTLDEALGRPLSQVFIIVDERTREPRGNPVDMVLRTDTVIELANHTLLIRRDGREYIIADSGAPIKHQDGRTMGVVLVFRDITEKRKLLDHLDRTQKLDSLGVLAGGIAHDFNNLLSGIFGYIEIARLYCQSESPAATYLAKALDVFTRASDLTRQLLTFAKGGIPSRKAAALRPILEKSVSFALSGSKVSAEFRIAADLPLCDIDAGQIGQVIDNLVINAQQAMPMGGTIIIAAGSTPDGEMPHPTLPKGNYVKISITDTGIGIPREILPRIFDPFFTTKHKGSGLGLATCYAIIQKHDGIIDVESEPGKGTTFSIIIPASRSKEEAAPEKPLQSHSGSGKILIMDDQEFILDVATQLFNRMGYAVTQARDGSEALEVFGNARETGLPFRCIFLDLTIPGGTGGREAIAEMRKLDPDIPIFASSGYSDDPIMSRPREFGFTDSIRKPFRAMELADLMERYFGKTE
jgi:PAS domain S-box-containing protein